MTFELQALHGDLFDEGCGAHVVLPDFRTDAQVEEKEDQERRLLLYGLLKGQHHLKQGTGHRLNQRNRIDQD